MSTTGDGDVIVPGGHAGTRPARGAERDDPAVPTLVRRTMWDFCSQAPPATR
jgi:hypothetical protein